MTPRWSKTQTVQLRKPFYTFTTDRAECVCIILVLVVICCVKRYLSRWICAGTVLISLGLCSESIFMWSTLSAFFSTTEHVYFTFSSEMKPEPHSPDMHFLLSLHMCSKLKGPVWCFLLLFIFFLSTTNPTHMSAAPSPIVSCLERL